MRQLRLGTFQLICLALLLLTGGSMTHAQTLSIFNVDTSNFPDLEAEFVVLDGAGVPMRDLDPLEFRATEDGISVDAQFTIDCPEADEPGPFNAVLVCDRSGSMSLAVPSGLSRFLLLKRGAKAFLTAVQYIPPTNIAITAFDDQSLLVAGFEATSAPLIRAIDSILLGGGTEYDQAFFDPFSGAIPMLARQPEGVPRVIVFITDGVPRFPPDTARIIAEAKAANIKIYTITLGLPMTGALHRIAEATGGASFGNVVIEDEMRAIYTSIALRSQGVKPCKIRWRSANGCGPNSVNRTFRMVMTRKGITGSKTYRVPARSIIELLTEPSFLWFGPVAPPNSGDQTVKITARGSAMRITGKEIPTDAPFQVIDWGGFNPPFVLQEGDSRTVTVRFTPTDSSIQSTSLTFLGEPCPIPAITLSGGLTSYRDIETLELLFPTGGESFNGCDSVSIRWGGIPPDSPIIIEFSSDNGATWRRIAKDVTGLHYMWAPPGPGTSYKVRITSTATGLVDSIEAIAGGGASVADGVRADQVLMVNPAGVAVVGDILYYSEIGGHYIRQVDLASGKVTIIAGTGAPGYSNDGGQAKTARIQNPSGIAVSGQFLYFSDNANHRVRRVDLATGIINTVAGTGAAGFSGDGGVGRNAQLQFPTGLAVGGDALYISDKGNNRVRRLDFKTNMITTVAGGGWIPDGDGSVATTVVLNAPEGLAFTLDSARFADSLFIVEEGGNRVRRVDMRTGIIATIAGTGTSGFSGDGRAGFTAQLNRPQGIAVVGDIVYIADTKNNRIRGVSRSTSIITTIAGTGAAGYSGDGGPAPKAELNAPGGLTGKPGMLFLADAFNDRIRGISIGTVGRSDSSHSSFNVTIGKLTLSIPGKLVDFGAMAGGESRDSAINAALCNSGSVPFIFDSTEVIGANASDFQFVSGTSSTPIPPGGCAPLEIRFTPSALGIRRARMVFHGTCAGSDTLDLIGMGAQPCGIEARERVEFASIAVGATKDSTIEDLICNRGTTKLDGRITITPADGAFTIVSGGGDFSLAPGECLDITVRFNAARKGAASAIISFNVPSACGEVRTILTGRGLTPRALAALDLAYPVVACWNGPRDTIVVITNTGDEPLTISGIELLDNNEGFAITSTLPLPGAPMVIAPNAFDSINIRFAPTSLGAKSATLRITSDASSSPTDLALSGRRDSLGIALAPASLAFDGQLPSGSYPLDSVITIVNSGTLPITIASAHVGGADSTRFSIDDRAFPVVIAPGDTARIHVLLLEPTSGSAYNALAELMLDDACDSSHRLVRLFASGAAPALVALPPLFRPLVCAEEIARDTIVTVTNPGGSALTISNVAIRPAAGSPFTWLGSTPIIIPAGGSAQLPVRFAAAAPGSYQAQLVLQSNAPGGDSIIQLAARRESISFAVAQSMLDFGLVPSNTQRQRIDTIINTGSLPISLRLANATSNFTPAQAQPIVLQPGESLPLAVLFISAHAGSYRDTLILTDAICGTTARIALGGDVFAPIRTVLRLPVDSAERDEPVELPIRLKIDDRARFDASDASTFTTTISFDGMLLMPLEAVGATITGQRFDSTTGRQTVTLSGSYGSLAGTRYAGLDPDGWERLALLRCRIPASSVTITDLRFEAFAWNAPEVEADTINGIFSTWGECAEGLRLVSQVRITKLRPQPATGSKVEVALELESDQEVTGVLVDGLGRRVRQLSVGRLRAGEQSVLLDVEGIASGSYWLMIETPFGSDAAQVVIAR